MSEPAADSVHAPDVPARIRVGLSAGLRTSWKIILFSVPLYMAVSLLKGGPILGFLGEVFAPYMGIFGLPGEAAFAFVAVFFLNIYAGIAVIVPLSLDAFQVTQCGLMMGLAHNLVVEGGVFSSTGTRGFTLTLCRMAIAAAAGLLLRGMYFLWGLF